MDIIRKIDELFTRKEFVVISIDGCAASGKTSLANKLKEKYNAEVVRMDYFFLPLSKRTIERLNTPGGNIDYERFKIEVVDKLGTNFTYGVFNCNKMIIDEYKVINKSRLLIVEGSYSLHPYFGKYYDLSVFLDIDSHLQIERIKKRDGEKMLSMFVNKWIKYEENYHKYYDIKNIVDIYIN